MEHARVRPEPATAIPTRLTPLPRKVFVVHDVNDSLCGQIEVFSTRRAASQFADAIGAGVREVELDRVVVEGELVTDDVPPSERLTNFMRRHSASLFVIQRRDHDGWRDALAGGSRDQIVRQFAVECADGIPQFALAARLIERTADGRCLLIDEAPRKAAA